MSMTTQSQEAIIRGEVAFKHLGKKKSDQSPYPMLHVATWGAKIDLKCAVDDFVNMPGVGSFVEVSVSVTEVFGSPEYTYISHRNITAGEVVKAVFGRALKAEQAAQPQRAAA